MKRVFVSGASGGIGFEISKKFLDNGYFVIAQYNSNLIGMQSLVDYAKQNDKYENLYCVKVDLSNSNELDMVLCDLRKSFKSIDVVVNNAGVGLYKLITDTTIADWEKVFSINVESMFQINNAFISQMVSNQCGKIINISSMWGKVGASMEVCYSASKSAVIGYTKALAKELAPSKINVNCICPGVIDTPMNARFNSQELEELKNSTPLGRLGKPSEVAELVYFLSQDSASFITGQTISIDGGFTL